MEQSELVRRSAGNFAIFMACAFLLWIWAAIFDRIAQFVRLSAPGHLTSVATSIASSSTLQAIISIWLLTAAVAIAFPMIWRPLSMTTTLMFDVGYGILGALTGFGLAIGLFGGGWHIFLWAVIYSVAIAVGYALVRWWLPLSEMQTYGKRRFILAGLLVLAAPAILIWG